MKIKLPGFTLIELLVVIGVIGVLASVLVIVINPVKQLQRARDTRRKSDIAQIQQSLELYRSDKGYYPPNPIGCGGALSDGSIIYLQKIPCDPKSPGTTPYTYTPQAVAAPQTYTISGCLENTADLDKVADATCSSGYAFPRQNP